MEIERTREIGTSVWVATIVGAAALGAIGSILAAYLGRVNFNVETRVALEDLTEVRAQLNAARGLVLTRDAEARDLTAKLKACQDALSVCSEQARRNVVPKVETGGGGGDRQAEPPIAQEPVVHGEFSITKNNGIWKVRVTQGKVAKTREAIRRVYMYARRDPPEGYQAILLRIAFDRATQDPNLIYKPRYRSLDLENFQLIDELHDRRYDAFFGSSPALGTTPHEGWFGFFVPANVPKWLLQIERFGAGDSIDFNFEIH